MRTVELHPAFLWTCEDCGRDHFVRSVNFEWEQVERMIPENQRAEMEDSEGSWCTAPDRVTCPDCGNNVYGGGCLNMLGIPDYLPSSFSQDFNELALRLVEIIQLRRTL